MQKRLSDLKKENVSQKYLLPLGHRRIFFLPKNIHTSHRSLFFTFTFIECDSNTPMKRAFQNASITYGVRFPLTYVFGRTPQEILLRRLSRYCQFLLRIHIFYYFITKRTLILSVSMYFLCKKASNPIKYTENIKKNPWSFAVTQWKWYEQNEKKSRIFQQFVLKNIENLQYSIGISN